jgi:polynucleotide 5'-kinase involved in rRNA processing
VENASLCIASPVFGLELMRDSEDPLAVYATEFLSLREVRVIERANVGRVDGRVGVLNPRGFGDALECLRIVATLRRLGWRRGVHSQRRIASQLNQHVTPGERRHLFLFGPVGRGKSRLAATLLNEAAEGGIAGAWIYVPWLVAIQLRTIDDPKRRPEAP